jgi:hypothetical protein
MIRKVGSKGTMRRLPSTFLTALPVVPNNWLVIDPYRRGCKLWPKVKIIFFIPRQTSLAKEICESRSKKALWKA